MSPSKPFICPLPFCLSFPCVTLLSQFFTIFLLIAQFSLVVASSQFPAPSKSNILPRARGPAIVFISVNHGRASPQGLLQTSDPLVLWCHAVDARLLSPRESRRELALDTEEIYFTHNGANYPANLSTDGSFNGTLSFDLIYASFAGNWTCHIRTKQFGNVSGEIAVYLRPVMLSNASLRIDDKDTFHFEADGVNAKRGEDTRLECPVYGHPKPEVTWRRGALELRNDERIKLLNDGTLLIRNVSYEDGDTYSCRTRNSASRRDKKSGTIIERKLRVKSELAWLPPLCIIFLIIVLLVIVILLCEVRKRRNEEKRLTTDEDEE